MSTWFVVVMMGNIGMLTEFGLEQRV